MTWLKLNNVVLTKEADRIANSVVPDQTAPSRIVEQSNLGLHCLPRPVYPKIRNFFFFFFFF